MHARLLREQSPASVAFYTWVYLAMLCAAFCASKAAAAAAGVCCVGPAMRLRLDPPVMRCAPGLSSCLPGIRLRFGPGSLDSNPPPASLGSEVDHPIASQEDTVNSDLSIVDSEPEAESDSDSESEPDWDSDSCESDVCDSDTVEDSDSEASASESPPRKRKKLR